jgi:hypothetical protein
MSFTELNGNDEALSLSAKRGRQQEHPILSRVESMSAATKDVPAGIE